MDRSRLCVRPDCAAPADVALRYDYTERTVWLDPLGDEPEPGVWGICGTHADSLTVPRGWVREDRTGPGTLPLFPPAPV